MPDTKLSAEIGFWPGLLVVGAALFATDAVTRLIHVGPYWQDASITTAVLFSALALSLRRAWPRVRLWRDLGVALAVHLFAISLVVRLFTANAMTIGGPIRTAASILEGVFVLALLWRRNVATR